MEKLIHDLRSKPEHVRKRIALGSSLGVTALVAVMWAATLSANGTFALSGQPAAVGGAPEQEDGYVLGGTGVKSNFSQLVGAVGAAAGATTSKSQLTIIDGDTSSTFERSTTTNNSNATVIPF
jgi:hypothetical protein